jgi:hypothetical protein
MPIAPHPHRDHPRPRWGVDVVLPRQDSVVPINLPAIVVAPADFTPDAPAPARVSLVRRVALDDETELLSEPVPLVHRTACNTVVYRGCLLVVTLRARLAPAAQYRLLVEGLRTDVVSRDPDDSIERNVSLFFSTGDSAAPLRRNPLAAALPTLGTLLPGAPTETSLISGPRHSDHVFSMWGVQSEFVLASMAGSAEPQQPQVDWGCCLLYESVVDGVPSRHNVYWGSHGYRRYELFGGMTSFAPWAGCDPTESHHQGAHAIARSAPYEPWMGDQVSLGSHRVQLQARLVLGDGSADGGGGGEAEDAYAGSDEGGRHGAIQDGVSRRGSEPSWRGGESGLALSAPWITPPLTAVFECDERWRNRPELRRERERLAKETWEWRRRAASAGGLVLGGALLALLLLWWLRPPPRRQRSTMWWTSSAAAAPRQPHDE